MRYIAAKTKSTKERCLDGSIVYAVEATYIVDGVEKAYVSVMSYDGGLAGPFEIDLDEIEITEDLGDYPVHL